MKRINGSEWTDFSKAECKLENTNNGVDLVISGVGEKKDYSYYYCITADNSEPKFDRKKYDTMVCTNNKFKVSRVEKYVELNQDLYLWVIEEKNDLNDNNEYEYDFRIKGKKLERPAYPKYNKVFSNTFLSNDATQIVFNIPWNHETDRKINIKIGKISDNEILSKIKENKDVGLQKLLEYSKTAKTIYDKQVDSSKSTITGYSERDYSSYHGSPVINLSLENGTYYFMYTELDDENGKYYPVEGITIARAQTYENGAWYLFFLGDESFKWDLSDNIDTEKPSNEDKKDPTVATKILPNTGATAIAAVIFGVLVINAVVVINKYNKFKDVK